MQRSSNKEDDEKKKKIKREDLKQRNVKRI